MSGEEQKKRNRNERTIIVIFDRGSNPQLSERIEKLPGISTIEGAIDGLGRPVDDALCVTVRRKADRQALKPRIEALGVKIRAEPHFLAIVR